jgi:hypothetical protein
MSEASTAEIRAWARANGHAVADRGRLPAAAVAAYMAAHQAPATADAGTSSRPPRRPVVRKEGARRQGIRPTPAPETGTDAWEAPTPAAEEPTPPPPEEPTWQPPAPDTPTVTERPAWQPTAWGAPPSAPPPSSPPQPQWGAPGPSPAWGPPPPPAPTGREGRDGLAITSLVLGIIPVFAGILGIVFGIVALVRIRRSGRRGRGLAIAGIVLGSLWFVGAASAVAIAVANTADRADDGAVVARGSVAATELRTGDCPTSLPDGVTRTLSVGPCTEPHVGEVFASFPISSGAYPGEAEVKRFGGGGCTDRLAGYVGPGREDEFDIVFLYPTDQSWRLGDRAVSCLVTAPDGAALPTRSVKAG